MNLTAPSNRFVRNWLAGAIVLGSGAVLAASFGGVPHPAVESQALSASAMNQNFEAVGQYVSALEARLAAIEAGPHHRVPAGTVVAFAGPAPQAGSDPQIPDGWLLCDGQPLSSAQYPALYAAIGTAHGHGTGAPGSFSLPDYRGLFLRGVAYDATTDPDKATRTAAAAGGNTGNAVGSRQLAETGQHDHGGGDHGHYLFAAGDPTTQINNGDPDRTCVMGANLENAFSYHIFASTLPPANLGRSSASGAIIAPAGGAETRPTNAYVNYIIKH